MLEGKGKAAPKAARRQWEGSGNLLFMGLTWGRGVGVSCQIYRFPGPSPNISNQGFYS